MRKEGIEGDKIVFMVIMSSWSNSKNNPNRTPTHFLVPLMYV